MLEEVNESMLEFVEDLAMDPGHEGSTYLVWTTEKKRKSKVETLTLEIFVAEPVCVKWPFCARHLTCFILFGPCYNNGYSHIGRKFCEREN